MWDGKLMEIYGLKLNNETNPIINSNVFNFSWKFKETDNIQSNKQVSYQIFIYDGTHKTVWNSEKIQSSKSINNEFADIQLEDQETYSWQVKVNDESNKEIYSKESKFYTETNWKDSDFISSDNNSSLPVFTTQFKLNDNPDSIKSATLSITGLGTYQLILNDQNLGEHNDIKEMLNPGWSDYHTQINYQSFDVKNSLSENNTLKIPIGKGYLLGRISQFSNYESIFSDNVKSPLLILKLMIKFDNGKKQVITTSNNPKWQFFDQLNHVDNDIYDGEIIDFTLGSTDTKSVTAPKIDQPTVKKILTPSNSAKVYEILKDKQNPILTYSYNPNKVIANPNLELGEVELTKITDSNWIADKSTRLLFYFGQNMAATINITFQSKTNVKTKVHVKTGEILNDGQGSIENKTGSDGPKNSLHHRNLISEIGGDAKSEEVFIVQDNNDHQYNATWTFHGFRYIEVEVDNPVYIKGIQQIPVTSLLHKNANLKTNNSDLNRLIKNIQYGEQSNYLSIPIDSPNRAERAGWSADAQIFTTSGLMGFDSTAFLKNYLEVINNTEDKSAYKSIMPKSFLPQLAQLQAAGWSDIGIILPWKLYKFTGNESFISKYYSNMVEYMNLIGSTNDVDTNYDDKVFGDWLGFAPASTPYMNAIYRAFTAQIMAEVSHVLNYFDKEKEYKKLFSLIKDFIQEKYVSNINCKFNLLTKTADNVDKSFQGYSFVDNSQTGLLWFLKLHLYSDKSQKDSAIQVLKTSIENNGQTIRTNMPENSLAVGFLGINILLPTLSEIHLNDTAYNLLLSDENPSWLLAVKNGATTLWERWDSYTKEKGISPDAMNSFNHYAYGSIAEWLYSQMLGIKVDPTNQKYPIIISPVIDTGEKYNDQERIKHVSGFLETIYGQVAVEWKSNDKVMTELTIDIPVNSEALLKLDSASAKNLGLLKDTNDSTDTFDLKLGFGKHSFKN